MMLRSTRMRACCEGIAGTSLSRGGVHDHYFTLMDKIGNQPAFSPPSTVNSKYVFSLA